MKANLLVSVTGQQFGQPECDRSVQLCKMPCQTMHVASSKIWLRDSGLDGSIEWQPQQQFTTIEFQAIDPISGSSHQQWRHGQLSRGGP